MGSSWGRLGIVLASTWSHFRVSLGSLEGHFRVMVKVTSGSPQEHTATILAQDLCGTRGPDGAYSTPYAEPRNMAAEADGAFHQDQLQHLFWWCTGLGPSPAPHGLGEPPPEPDPRRGGDHGQPHEPSTSLGCLWHLKDPPFK